MNKKDRRNFRNRKSRIERRLEKTSFPEKEGPVFAMTNMHYEMADRITATPAGGVGAIHTMVRRLGLERAIDEHLHLLKIHLPYQESDHVLNIAYNILAGGTKLEDLETLRQDEAYMNMLGAVRIPDPTTAGDFLRRFERSDIIKLMDVINDKRREVWSLQPKAFRERAVIDVDGSLVPTAGEKKQGMDISYKGIWGYHPLIVSLANSQEPLFLVNRSGNVPSHDGAGPWMNKAIDLCEGVFSEVRLRGDTDFSLTSHFDEWSERGVLFTFGYDAHSNLIKIADSLGVWDWTPLFRAPKYKIKTRKRKKRVNTKERTVINRNFETIRLCEELVAEFSYQPGKCKQPYRMIVLKKNLSVERGEPTLFPNEIKYFFYVTNDEDLSAEEVIGEANQRCNQENLIEQLKNGVHSLRVPVYDLTSNWAYMVIASLAWTLKAWFGLTQRRREDREDVLSMEFKRFLHRVMCIPGQVIKGARRIRVRLLAITDRVRLLFSSIYATARMKPIR